MANFNNSKNTMFILNAKLIEDEGKHSAREEEMDMLDRKTKVVRAFREKSEIEYYKNVVNLNANLVKKVYNLRENYLNKHYGDLLTLSAEGFNLILNFNRLTSHKHVDIFSEYYSSSEDFQDSHDSQLLREFIEFQKDAILKVFNNYSIVNFENNEEIYTVSIDADMSDAYPPSLYEDIEAIVKLFNRDSTYLTKNYNRRNNSILDALAKCDWPYLDFLVSGNSTDMVDIVERKPADFDHTLKEIATISELLENIENFSSKLKNLKDNPLFNKEIDFVAIQGMISNVNSVITDVEKKSDSTANININVKNVGLATITITDDEGRMSEIVIEKNGSTTLEFLITVANDDMNVEMKEHLI